MLLFHLQNLGSILLNPSLFSVLCASVAGNEVVSTTVFFVKAAADIN
jgi:hypothetical protein